MAKVLIIEDDPFMRSLYKNTFELEGFQVELANDGEKGLNAAKANVPDIILLDIMMPQMNGLQALEQLKLDPDLQKIPVAMLSNLTEEQDAQKALSKGALKYIIKSEYEPQEIVSMVREILRGNHNS